MSQWYFSSNGKAQGPVSSEILIENLRAGKLTLVDLVFREGESAWCTIGEIPEFREAFKALPLSPLPPMPTRSTEEAEEEPGVFARSIPLAESHSVQPLQKPQAGWPQDWQLSTSWIILKKRADGSGFDQDGPFSAEQIIEMIGDGRIEYAQYCWKPGYTRWFRIGNLPEFDRRKRDRDNDTVNQIIAVPEIRDTLPALSREELLSSVERQRHVKKTVEQTPSEAVGVDLTVSPIDVVSREVASGVAPQIATAVPVVTQETLAAMPTSYTDAAPVEKIQTSTIFTPEAEVVAPVIPPKKTGGAKRAARLIVAGGVAGIAVIALLQFASQKDQAPEFEKSASQKKAVKRNPKRAGESELASVAPPRAAALAAVPPPLPSSAASAPSAAAAQQPNLESAPAARSTASTLEIVPLKLTTSPSLTFQTDARVGEPITVRLSAKTGEILRYGSYFKTFEVTREPGEIPNLDLASLQLPLGTYNVTATAGAASANAQIFIGNRGPEFVNQLERHIKAISFRQQSERKALLSGTQRLEQLTQTLVAKSQSLKGQPKAWKKELDGWRLGARDASMPVLQLAQVPRNEMTYPDQLAAFQSAAERLAQVANEMDAAMSQKRDIASSGAETVLAELRQLRDESARMSGRPQPVPNAQ